jgi:hypothetical protein
MWQKSLASNSPVLWLSTLSNIFTHQQDVKLEE